MKETNEEYCGFVVVPREHCHVTHLHCATSVYTHAICMSVDPFILVSSSSDMRWDGLDINDMLFLCKADQSVIELCKRRM